MLLFVINFGIHWNNNLFINYLDKYLCIFYLCLMFIVYNVKCEL